MSESSDDEEEDEEDAGSPKMGRSPDNMSSSGTMARFMNSTASVTRQAEAARDIRRELETEEERNKMTDPGLWGKHGSASDRLRALIKKNYGTCVLGWRQAFDPLQMHLVCKADFYRVLRELGFQGDAKQAWRELAPFARGDGERRQVTLADLDPLATEKLRVFYDAYRQRFAQVNDLVAGSSSCRIGKTQFMARCEPLLQKRSSKDADDDGVDADGDKETEDTVDLEAVFKNLQSIRGFISSLDLEWLAFYCERRRPTQGDMHDDISRMASITTSSFKSKAAKEEELSLADRFRKLLRKKYGSLAEAWKVIDADGHGYINDEGLEKAAKKVGWEGDALDLWDSICGPETDYFTPAHLEPAGNEVVASFKAKCVMRYGNLRKAFEDWRAEQKPLVSKEEFTNFCLSVSFDGNARYLFYFLDARRAGWVLLTAIDEETAKALFGADTCTKAQEKYDSLPAQTPRIESLTLVERATRECGQVKRPPERVPNFRNDLIRLLEERHGGPVAAWQSVLDPDGRGKLKKDDFVRGCDVAGFSGNADAAWRFLGLKESGSCRFKDLFPETIEEVKEFKKQAKAKSLTDIVEAMEEKAEPEQKDSAGGLQLNAKDFRKLCEKIEYKGQVDHLMRHLDPGRSGTVSTKALAWFDEAPEEKALQTLLKKHNKQRKKNWAAKLKSVTIGPLKNIMEEQGAKSEKTAEQRATAKEKRETKEELLVFLRQKYGLIARAWRIAIDPNDLSELKPKEWENGLKETGFIGVPPPGTEIFDADSAMVRRKKTNARKEKEAKDKEKAAQLFTLFKDKKDTGIKLAHLDRATPMALAELLESCVHRYGSVQRAFESLDPEGKGYINALTFMQLCHEARLSDAATRLLALLDAKKTDQILLEDLDADAADTAMEACQERKRKEKKKAEEAAKDVGSAESKKEPSALTQLKQRFRRKHGTIVRAWRKVLNPEGKERIDFMDFEEQCFKVGCSEKQVEVAWDAMTTEDTLSLLELEPALEQDFKELKMRLRERYGSMDLAFEDVVTANGIKVGEDPIMINETAYLSLCFDIQLRGNHKRFFEYLDEKDQKEIALSRIDEAAAERVREKLEGKEKSIREREEKIAKASESKKKTRKPPEGASEAVDEGEDGGSPIAEQTATSASAIRATACRETLAKRFGGRLKAWRMIDFQGCAQLSKQDFCTNLAVAGYTSNGGHLWRGLSGEQDAELEQMTLREFQPELFQQLIEFKKRCEAQLKSLKGLFKGSPRLSCQAFCDLCERMAFKGGDEVVLGAAAGSVVGKRAKLKNWRANKRVWEIEIIEDKQTSLAPLSALVPCQTIWSKHKRSVLKASADIRDAETMSAQDLEAVKRHAEKKGYVGFSVRKGEEVEEEDEHGTVHTKVSDPVAQFKISVGVQRPTKADLKRQRGSVFYLSRHRSVKQWEELYQEFAGGKGDDGISWEEVRFLQDQWKINEEGVAEPVTSVPKQNISKTNLKSGPPAAPDFPLHVGGGTPKQPELYSKPATRMHKVQKSQSLPNLTPPLRATWNDRHHVLDTHGNKDTQIIHLVNYVMTQDRDRCKARIDKALKEVPVTKLLEDFLYPDGRPGDAGGGEDEDESEEEESDEDDR